MVEADVSGGLEQLDEALSGLTSGKLKISRLQSFESYLYTVTQHRNLQGSKEVCRRNLMLKAYVNMHNKTGFQP